MAKDSFEYEAFYNNNSPYELLYFKTGNLMSIRMKNAVALYTLNDTTVSCELYEMTANKWVKTIATNTLHISEFSPAFFSVCFADYNFDGYKDLKVNFYQTMGTAWSYVYILTYNPLNHSLTLHQETIDIPNLEIDPKNKQLISSEYSNPNADKEDFEVKGVYDWSNGTLQIMSKKKKLLKHRK